VLKDAALGRALACHGANGYLLRGVIHVSLTHISLLLASYSLLAYQETVGFVV